MKYNKRSSNSSSINWANKIIEKIMRELGVSIAEAERIAENTYRKVLHKLRKEGFTDINITRETYFSMMEGGVKVVNVHVQKGKKSGTVDLTDVGKSADPEKAINLKRLENFIEKYGKHNFIHNGDIMTLNDLIDLYKSGAITYDELKKAIGEFKATNPTYLSREAYSSRSGKKARSSPSEELPY